MRVGLRSSVGDSVGTQADLAAVDALELPSWEEKRVLVLTQYIFAADVVRTGDLSNCEEFKFEYVQ